jgi:competence protein ComEC
MRYRLLAIALLVWGFEWACFQFSFLICISLIAFLGVLIVVIFRKIRSALCMIVLLISLLIGNYLHVVSLHHNSLAKIAQQNEFAGIECTVRTDPHQLLPKVKNGKKIPGNFTNLCEVESAEIYGRRITIHVPIRLISRLAVKGGVGARVEGFGQVFATSEKDVAAQIYFKNGVSLISRGAKYSQLINNFRKNFSLVALHHTSDYFGLIPGLIIGDTSGESAKMLGEMQRSGLTHLTAVSGENFTIICVALIWFLSRTLPYFHIRYFLVGVICFAFMFIARPSASVLRAAVMLAVYLFGKVSGRKPDAIPALACAILVIIGINPMEAIDPGFALSTLATLGILTLYPHLHKLISSRIHSQIRDRALSPLALSLVANLFTVPISYPLSGYFSWSSIPANMLVEPLVAPVTIFGGVAAIASQFSEVVAKPLIYLCIPFTWCIVKIAHLCSLAPVVH